MHQFGITNGDLPAVYSAMGPLPCDRIEALDCRQFHTPLSGRPHDGFCQRVLTLGLHRGYQRQERRLCMST